MKLIDLVTKNSAGNDIFVSVENIQEVIVVNVRAYYKVQVTLLSGRTYFLADSNGNDVFESISAAQVVRDNFLLLLV